MNTFETIGKPANTDLPDAYYGYDGNGNRAYKLTGTSELTHEYGPNLSADMNLSFPILYVNLYMVLSPQGVFKYYYNGTQHIASRQCGPTKKLFSSILNKDTLGIANKIWRATSLMSRVLFYNEECNEDTLIHAPIPCIDINGVEHLDFAPLCSGIPQVACASFTYSPSRICSMLKDTIEEDWDNDVFFCHSDHLGSASWLTNDIGGVAQYIHYMPYGELWRDQQDETYDERYKFTAKERDAETGYDYFGARYYASQLPAWLSVDQLADKYPDANPYAYCNGNPIKYIDPDGRKVQVLDADGVSALYNTLNTSDYNYVTIDKQGYVTIDSEHISHTSSNNYMALAELVGSNTDYTIATGNSFEYKNEKGAIVTGNMLPIQLVPDFGSDCFGFDTNETGWLGVTQTPGAQPNKYNSTDNGVHVLLNSTLSTEGKAQILSHELYGHALLYQRGQPHTHDIRGQVEQNSLLRVAITIAISETKQNMKRR